MTITSHIDIFTKYDTSISRLSIGSFLSHLAIMYRFIFKRVRYSDFVLYICATIYLKQYGYKT